MEPTPLPNAWREGIGKTRGGGVELRARKMALPFGFRRQQGNPPAWSFVAESSRFREVDAVRRGADRCTRGKQNNSKLAR